jgi:guanosine-3',5'-bis(diphosphate) 3'-pyrophosphohydrolase
MDAQHLTVINIVSAAAARAHAGMTRNDCITPYIVHPARVALLVQHFGGSHIAIISAWLHDIFEDCNPDVCRKTQEMINNLPLKANEIDKIIIIISALTKNDHLPKEDRMKDSLNRIIHSPDEAVLIKICDRIDNLIDAQWRDEEFKLKYFTEAEFIIEKLSKYPQISKYSGAVDTLLEIINHG